MGPIGEHVLEFTALLPTGEEITCTPKKNADLFYSMISGLGNAGRVYIHHHADEAHPFRTVSSGCVACAESSAEHFPTCSITRRSYDYIVGWLDTTNGGKSLGRGQIHGAQ